MKQFELEYVEAELRKLAPHLRRKVTIAVFGGASMARMRLKAATKDIDVVVRTEREAKDLIAALAGAGYRTPETVAEPYLKMQARKVIENPDGFRWDVFARTIIGFDFSEAMWERTSDWLVAGGLEVRQAPAEAIFILKALTERERDRADMDLLRRRGLDTDWIHGEVLRQAEDPGPKRFAAFFFAGLQEYAERYGEFPGMDVFEALAEREAAAEVILTRLQSGPADLRTLMMALDAETDLVERAVQRLLRQGLAVREGSVVKLSAKRP